VLTVLINDRTRDRATHVIWEGEYRLPAGTELVVKATLIGLYPETTARVAVHFGTVERGPIACDVILNAPRTLFIREAEARGCNILDGLGMLVNQSAIAIKNRSVLKPGTGVMRGGLGVCYSRTPSGPAADDGPDRRIIHSLYPSSAAVRRVDRREVIYAFGEIFFPFLQFDEIKSDKGDIFCTLTRQRTVARDSLNFIDTK
jgi:hypothetical protein